MNPLESWFCVEYVFALFEHVWCTVFDYLYCLLACVIRIEDEQFEEHPDQFAEGSEQQFFEEGKCP